MTGREGFNLSFKKKNAQGFEHALERILYSNGYLQRKIMKTCPDSLVGKRNTKSTDVSKNMDKLIFQNK